MLKYQCRRVNKINKTCKNYLEIEIPEKYIIWDFRVASTIGGQASTRGSQWILVQRARQVVYGFVCREHERWSRDFSVYNEHDRWCRDFSVASMIGGVGILVQRAREVVKGFQCSTHERWSRDFNVASTIGGVGVLVQQSG